MPSKKPRLMTYTSNEIVSKFNFISKYEKRSASKELEFIVEEYIKTFENKHGELIIEDNGNVSIAKPTPLNLAGKSSQSKIG